MAYSTLISSVADEQVMAFRDLRRKLLEPSHSIQCSHILTTWVDPDDLRNSLRLALDGGEVLRSDLWHPFRVPRWHPAATVGNIGSNVQKALNQLTQKFGPPDPADWYGVQIGKVVSVFAHAAATRQGIVTFLQPPMDEARASKVVIPVVGYFGSTFLSFFR